METELIHAERLLAGDYRYRLTVRRHIWIFRWKAVFFAAGTTRMTWYNQDLFRVENMDLANDLTLLLVRALACHQVPPQPSFREPFYA